MSLFSKKQTTTLITAALLLGLTSCSTSVPVNPPPQPQTTIAPTSSPLIDTSIYETHSYKQLRTVATSEDTEKKIAVTGTVVKVIEKETTTSILVSMSETENQLFYCEYDPGLFSFHPSEGDKITAYGNYHRSTTMLLDDCSTAFVPYITVEHFEFK